MPLDDEPTLYTETEYIRTHHDILRFIVYGWTLDEVQRYIIQHQLGPWIHIFNVHSEIGDQMISSALCTSTQLYQDFRKLNYFEDNLHTIADEILREPDRANAVRNRVRVERLRRNLPVNVTYNIADHPALR